MTEKERYNFFKENSTQDTLVGLNPWTDKIQKQRNASRQEVYNEGKAKLNKSNCLLLELPTGYGKSKLSIDLINYLFVSKRFKDDYIPHVLILVAKRVHKQTWQEEMEKWGGINSKAGKVNIRMECYESLHKCFDIHYDIVLADECFRGDTEILTDSGYKQFKDLSDKDLVAQFTQEGNIEFVKPLRLIKKRHVGEICKLHLGRERYCYLTPNHNMVYRTPNVEGWRMKPVKELGTYSGISIPISGKGTGNNTSLEPLDRLLIAVQADGTLQRHQLHYSAYSICVKKERKKERLKWILSELDNWSKIPELRGYDRYIVNLPIGDAKLLSTHFDINMGYDRANEFIDEVIQWDGYKPNDANYLHYSTKIKENADFVAAVAIQAGYKTLCSVEKDERKETHSPIYRVFIRKLEDISTQPMTKEYLPYDNDVYCVEVPTHMIVVRSEGYSFIAGNCHHIGSDQRLELLKSLNYGYFLGLSATIPRKLKQAFKFRYHAEIVTCDIIEAIEDEILPEPTILLFPLMLDNRIESEEWEFYKNASGPAVRAPYKEIRKYKYNKKVHSIISMTQKQKCMEYDSLISFFKRNNRDQAKLYMSGKRLEFLADIKLSIIRDILEHLKHQRTITFCKSIKQAELAGRWCIHSKNEDADEFYKAFNAKKINHITAVNILNENANLVDCKYAIFCNLSSSEISVPQRIGRSLRHKSPVIIVPYYQGTREEELAQTMVEGFNKDHIKVIHSIKEI